MRNYPGMTEENENFVKEVLKPKGRVTVFYPEEVQLLLEELRGRLSLKGKFPFLALPGADSSKAAFPENAFLYVLETEVVEGKPVLRLSDKVMYFLFYQERFGKQNFALCSRMPGNKDDTNPNWPFPEGKLEPWQEEIRDAYKNSDLENWPKG